jgi:quinol monooxygenase YgiN
MVIVSGQLFVDPAERASYLDGCREVVSLGRAAPGCLGFAISADLLDPGRINVHERWASQADAEAFRGSGPTGEQQAALRGASVGEYDVSGSRSLTG